MESPRQQHATTVYVAVRPIPELGAEPGDTIVVEPTHPTDPLLIVRAFDHAGMRGILAAGVLANAGHVSGPSLPRRPRLEVVR